MTRNAAGIVAKITGSVHCVRDESVTLCIFNTRQSTYLDQIDSSRKHLIALMTSDSRRSVAQI